MISRLRALLRWLHPDRAWVDAEFQDHLDAQAITGIKLLGILLVVLAAVAQVILNTLYLAETVKTQEGLALSLRFLALGLVLLAALRLPFLRRPRKSGARDGARPLLLVVMCFLIADTLHLQLLLFPIHRAQIGLFIASLCFIAFTFLPYRPWVVGAFGAYGLAIIVGLARWQGLEIHPYADTGVFWLAAQFASLAVITVFFRAAILDMQIGMRSMQEDIEDIKSILGRAESQKTEFKASFRYDYRSHQANADISTAVIKVVAGFLNADGGAVILGVDDNGRPIGLEKDYLTLKKKNADGYELAIVQALSDACGADVTQNLRFSFLPLEEKEICIIRIRRASKPVYVEAKGHSTFYIRTGNSTQSLDTKRAVEYIRTRFK